MNESSLKSVIAERSAEIHAIAGVIGVAESIDHGEPCILVMLSTDDPEARKKILSVLSGYPVRIVVTGEATLRD